MSASELNGLDGLIQPMGLKERIQEIVDAGHKKSDIAKAAGKTASAVSQWLSGASLEVKASSAAGIQSLTGFSAVWIATGKGPKMAKEVFDSNVARVGSGRREYPVISAIQAGLVKEINDPYAAGDGFDVEVGEDIWSEWTFGLQIEGDSMAPDFKQGDRVLIDPKISPNPGDFVVAKNHRQEATFKKYRVRGIDEKGHELFELVPLNDDYETMRSDTHQLKIIGVMVEHRRKYRRPSK